MKKVILLFLLLPLFAKAQDSISSPRLGLTFGMTAATDAAIGWTPGISFTYKKHEIYASAILVNKFYDSPKTYTGFQGGYRFYPYGHKTRFGLLFGYDFDYFTATFDKPVEGYTYGVPVIFTRSTKIIGNFVSFGFRANILKNLFLSSNVGVGVGKFEQRMYEHSANSTGPYDDLYSDNFSLTINANLTYHFLSLKRK